MAWNRPSAAHKPQPKKTPNALKGALAGLVIVLVLGAVYFFMLDSKPKVEVKKTTKTHRIKEVTPAPATNRVEKAVADKAEKPRKTQKDLDDDFVRRNEAKYGTNIPPGIATAIYYIKNPPKHIYKAPREFPYLTNHADRQVAAVLYTEPGTFFIEVPTYGEKFDQEFVNSLLSPLKVEADDTQEAKDVKNFVMEMRKEIAALVKQDGRKPSEIMNEQAQLMYDLGRYETQLADALRAARKNPNLSDDDVRDLFAAANVLRKKKGLPERPVPSLTRRAISLKAEQERALRKAERKASELNKETEK